MTGHFCSAKYIGKFFIIWYDKYNMNSTDNIIKIKGIGKKTAESFAKMDIETIGDLLRHFPRDYVQFPKAVDLNEQEQLVPDKNYAFRVLVNRSVVVRNTSRMPISLLDIGDEGHKIQLIWYHMPYIKSTVNVGKHYIFYGKVIIKNKHFVMEQPTVYTLEKYQEIEEAFIPVYALTQGITNNLLVKTLRIILAEDTLIKDYLPNTLREYHELCEYNYAIKQIHFPDTMENLITARNRLVFDEFFVFIMGLQYHKEKRKQEENHFFFGDICFIQELMAKLPYELTNAQKRALREITSDMTGPYVMQRLIQGDVGSGKTIVAFLAMAWTSVSGYQSAIMAPTEVLARQHYESYQSMCEQFGLSCKVILITGSMTQKQKRQAYERLQLYPDAMVIGTHALIQERTIFDNLALVITDEQHRFGVKQRDIFSEKGDHPHVLVMSATPIPRTLAIILYGDLDISVIDEVPAKRLPIKNCVVDTRFRPKAYDFIRQQIAEGHQAYVICPLVEGTENSECENVTDYGLMLAEEFKNDRLPEVPFDSSVPSGNGDGNEKRTVRVGILHGKMKSDLKNEIMEQFSRNELQILVSTTVVEVGVNVPNATVMMIENAERFGLAQLHQLRGRVGRGDAQSYCMMINSSNSKTAKKRLEILNKSNDGFFIASEDLKLRGPGDFFGIRQSGEIVFELADIYQDSALMLKASESVNRLLEEDPDLEMEEHQMLRERMEHFMDQQLKKMNL